MPCEAPKKQVLAQKLGEILGGRKLAGARAELEHRLLVGSREGLAERLRAQVLQGPFTKSSPVCFPAFVMAAKL